MPYFCPKQFIRKFMFKFFTLIYLFLFINLSNAKDLEIDIVNDKDLFRTGYYKKDNIKIKFDLDFLFIEEYIICHAKKS